MVFGYGKEYAQRYGDIFNRATGKVGRTAGRAARVVHTAAKSAKSTINMFKHKTSIL